jgi:hypothetical protein
MLANTRNGKIAISSKSAAMAQPVTSAGTQKVQRSCMVWYYIDVK